MKQNIKSGIISFLITIKLLLPSQAMTREDSQDCQIPHMKFIRELIPPENFSVRQEIDFLKSKRGLSDTKAKGAVGEIIARGIVESKKIEDPPFNSFPYVSIFTLFKSWGCEITPMFRNPSDNGLDDVFIIPSEGGWNDAYPPIFHEAKYAASGGMPRLGKNRLSCDQLSIKWIEGHLYTAQYKSFNLSKLCFPSDIVPLKVPSCDSCNNKILSCLVWLNEKFRNRDFDRTASVLDRDGIITFYAAIKDHPPQYTYSEFRYSNLEVLSSPNTYTEEDTESEELLSIQDLKISEPINYKETYSPTNISDFINFIPREVTDEEIANTCNRRGHQINAYVIGQLSRNINFATRYNFSELWETLKETYPEYFQEWLDS